jgi:serine/threonine protein kinase
MQPVTGPGHVVAERYELLNVIGHGSMGTVWRARDRVLAREVAVKEVRHPRLMSPQDRAVTRERSLREARVAARLTHPGVVTVHDVIEAEGSPWIVMELVPARSLARVLAEDGPMPPAQAAEMGTVLLEALGRAHAAGIVHRDVKPGNVLITPSGRTVLTDFGIAQVAGDARLTQAGMVMGTPGFCAPERIRGAPASPASDLWSLGATLYAAVEGHGPFDGQGSAMAVLANIVHGDPPPATSAGPLGPVIAALMNRDPAARPDATAARRLLTEACESSQAGQPTETTRLGGAGRPAKSDRAAGTGQVPDPAAAAPTIPLAVARVAAAEARATAAGARATLAGARATAAGARATEMSSPPQSRAQQPRKQPAGAWPETPAATPAGPRQPPRPGRHRRGLLLGDGGAAAR